jgi:hypothetical protein
MIQFFHSFNITSPPISMVPHEGKTDKIDYKTDRKKKVNRCNSVTNAECGFNGGVLTLKL